MSEYKVYLDGVVMPLGISNLETKIKNRNDEVDLINGKVKNLPKYPGLTTWKFTVLLPTAYNPDGRDIQPVDFYLSHFEKLKVNKKPFRFIVSRSEPLSEGSKEYTNHGLYETNVAVTLEEYTRKESSDIGLFSEVEINLKQYAEYKPVTVTLTKPDENEYIDPNDPDNPDNPVDPDEPVEPEPDVPKPPEEPEYVAEVQEELKRLEDRDIPTSYKVGYNHRYDESGNFVRAYATWKDVSKEIFGSDKYWRGIRDTNPDKMNPPQLKYKDRPGELYPLYNSTLAIDSEAIITLIYQKYPEDLK